MAKNVRHKSKKKTQIKNKDEDFFENEKRKIKLAL
jgi:hypothetical protein